MPDHARAAASASPVKLHTIKDVCGMTGLCRQVVDQLIVTGELDHLRFGRRVAIPDDALQSLLAGRRRTGRATRRLPISGEDKQLAPAAA